MPPTPPTSTDEKNMMLQGEQRNATQNDEERIVLKTFTKFSFPMKTK